MNIHEHQAKEILKQFGAPVSNGVVVFNSGEVNEKIKVLNTKNLVIKAQIHAGGRGKAGGVKLVNRDKAISETEKMLNKVIVTHQTGPKGKKVNRIYIQEAYDIDQELYLSCLVDRDTSKIAFISSTEGGVDIETVAKKNPEKIITTKIDFKKKITPEDFNEITKIFSFNKNQLKDAKNLVNALFNILINKDASLIEINPLIITKQKKLICLDAKMNFDDNSMFRRP